MRGTTSRQADELIQELLSRRKVGLMAPVVAVALTVRVVLFGQQPGQSLDRVGAHSKGASRRAVDLAFTTRSGNRTPPGADPVLVVV
jgi:hypothetical protein